MLKYSPTVTTLSGFFLSCFTYLFIFKLQGGKDFLVPRGAELLLVVRGRGLRGKTGWPLICLTKWWEPQHAGVGVLLCCNSRIWAFKSCCVFNSSNPHTKSISYELITAALIHARNQVKRCIFHMINLCAGFACIHESNLISRLHVHRKTNMNGCVFICKALSVHFTSARASSSTLVQKTMWTFLRAILCRANSSSLHINHTSSSFQKSS